MRASGVVSLVLLTLVTALGISTRNRWSLPGLPAFATAGLHRSVSLVAVLFLGLHVATAVFDPYALVGVTAVLVPFTAGYRALWVGLGTVSLDLVAVLIVTSLLRSRLSPRVWRTVHWAAYLSWPLAVFHSLGVGTDSPSTWLRSLAAGCAVVVAIPLAARLWHSGETAKHVEPTRRAGQRAAA
jgi:sulfoxide reductase heme-binding subunit YedZ